MKLGEAFERISDSWWPVPAAGVLTAIVLAGGALTLDEVLHPPPLLAFRGDAEEARQLLSTITSAMLSFIGLVFSVSIVVFTLASGQFSPRVLRTFLRDRWSQSTLAVFVGTFVLALVALWSVRGPGAGGESAVPDLTITLVFVLVALCVGMFVHFVHHITQEIRAVTVIGRIYAETIATIEHRYPRAHDDPGAAGTGDAGPPADDGDGSHVLRADETGVLANLRVGTLIRRATRDDIVIELLVRMGDFVVEGEPVARVHGGASEASVRRIRNAIVLDPERSYRRDVAFGIRKLIDIAERALSPGINDPTTAVQCVDRIYAVLLRLSGRDLDTGKHRDADGVVRLFEPMPSWQDYVALAFDELRHWGAGSLRVHERLHVILTRLLASAPEDRHQPLHDQLRRLASRSNTDLPEAERDAVGSSAAPSRTPRWNPDTDNERPR